jgi:hypothetical protein
MKGGTAAEAAQAAAEWVRGNGGSMQDAAEAAGAAAGSKIIAQNGTPVQAGSAAAIASRTAGGDAVDVSKAVSSYHILKIEFGVVNDSNALYQGSPHSATLAKFSFFLHSIPHPTGWCRCGCFGDRIRRFSSGSWGGGSKSCKIEWGYSSACS